jgi:hypothetical protein
MYVTPNTKSSRWSIYIHVWLLTYFHIFSLRLETLEYILQQHLIISHCEYQYKNGQIRTTWNYGSKIYCSTSAPKNISQFSNISPNGGNIIYNHCKFSANFRFRKMFYPQNFVVESRVKSSLNLIVKTYINYSYIDYLIILLNKSYSLLFFDEFWLIFFHRIISTLRHARCNGPLFCIID